MSTTPQPTKRKLGLDDIEAIDAAAQDYARKHGVPTGADREGAPTAIVTPFKPKRAPSRRIHIEGTFRIPCRGGMMQTECRANKMKARATR